MIRNTEVKYKTLQGTRREHKKTGLLVPEARNAMDSFKHRIASDLGIDFKTEDKGNFTTKDCGRVGGEMVRRMIEQAKLQMMNESFGPGMSRSAGQGSRRLQ